MQLINDTRCSSSITQPPSPVPAAARPGEDALCPPACLRSYTPSKPSLKNEQSITMSAEHLLPS